MVKGKVWGRKTWVVLAILLIATLIVVGILVILNIKKNEDPVYVAKESNESVAAIDEEIRSKFEDEFGYSMGDAINDYETEMNVGTNTRKIYVALYYASFINDMEADVDRAIEIMLEVEPLINNNEVAVDYYVALRNLYQMAGMEEQVEFYNQKVLELMPQGVDLSEETVESGEAEK